MRPARVLGVVPVLAVVAAAIPLAEAALCGRGCRAALVALAIAAPLGILARWRRCSGVIGALVTAAAIVANALTESMPGNGLLLVALVSLWWVRGGGGAFAAGALAALLWAEGGWPPTGPAGLLAFVLARDIGACTVPTRWSLTSTAAGFAAVAMVVSLTFDLGLSIDEPRTLQVHLDPLTTRAPRIALEAFLTVALLAHARGRTWSVPGVALGLPSLFLLIALEPALPMVSTGCFAIGHPLHGSTDWLYGPVQWTLMLVWVAMSLVFVPWLAPFARGITRAWADRSGA